MSLNFDGPGDVVPYEAVDDEAELRGDLKDPVEAVAVKHQDLTVLLSSYGHLDYHDKSAFTVPMTIIWGTNEECLEKISVWSFSPYTGPGFNKTLRILKFYKWNQRASPFLEWKLIKLFILVKGSQTNRCCNERIGKILDSKALEYESTWNL